MQPDEHLRYPIGKFSPKENYTEQEREEFINSISRLPVEVEEAYRKAVPHVLTTPYRDGGWTFAQVIHHLADSHMNAYIRMKWTLTEETPLIKAYDETRWAVTPEISSDPIFSINILNALHAKWTVLLRALSEKELKRQFIHPETQKHISLERMLALYAWHGQHHVAHLHLVLRK
jgi:hypothetical protein